MSLRRCMRRLRDESEMHPCLLGSYLKAWSTFVLTQQKVSMSSQFFWQNYLSLRKSQYFDELQVKKASSNAPKF